MTICMSTKFLHIIWDHFRKIFHVSRFFWGRKNKIFTYVLNTSKNTYIRYYKGFLMNKFIIRLMYIKEGKRREGGKESNFTIIFVLRVWKHFYPAQTEITNISRQKNNIKIAFSWNVKIINNFIFCEPSKNFNNNFSSMRNKWVWIFSYAWKLNKVF